MFCTADQLKNESDVEQKFLWPLLTAPQPQGLGYSAADIRTKPDIRQLRIDKGAASKLYRPDYVLVIAGIPVFMIEAKTPGEDLLEALREARLYANEVNASFPHGVNPCQRVIASDGLVTVTCPVDVLVQDCTVELSQIDVTSEAFHRFAALVSRAEAQSLVDALRQKLTNRPFQRATDLVGGQSVRNEEIGYNTFGSKLALDYRHVFNPESRKDRAYIVRNAYVRSHRREHYVDEIDRIIKTAVVSTIPGTRLIEDTSAPAEILEALRRGKQLENEVMLLVGARGSGKTTFVDYLREVKLGRDLLDSTLWVHLNLNEGPHQESLLDTWLLEQIAKGLHAAHPSVDFEERNVLDNVFGVELNRLRKGPLARLDSSSEAYELRIADELATLQRDPLKYAHALARFLAGERKKLLVIVFDNCDKRDRDQQLTAFEAARWLQSEIRCLIILPLRDMTYESFKDVPPLDTTIKDLVFRIDPPPFSKVLSSRLKLVLTDLNVKAGGRLLDFTLESGIRVEYPATELGFYLASIFRSLYEYDRLIRSLLVGLAGRDIRRAMEIFLEFCRSGHIGTAEYLKIVTFQGKYSLPYDVVTRVLLRRNRRFYDGDSSFLTNLFQCDPVDASPDTFARLSILKWLRSYFRERGPISSRGFHPATKMIRELVLLGHDANRIREELKYLIRRGCILTEHQQPELRSDADLLKLSPAGFVHLQAVSDVNYLAACAEDTWTNSKRFAESVARRIGSFGPRAHYSTISATANATEFVQYLCSLASREVATPVSYMESSLENVAESMEQIARDANYKIRGELGRDGWELCEERFHRGMECAGTVAGVQNYGVFVKLDGGPTGLIHFKSLPPHRSATSFSKGERVVVGIERVQIQGRRIGLTFVSPFEKEA